MRNLRIGIWSIAGIFLIPFSGSNAYSQAESIRINGGYDAFMKKDLDGFDDFAREYNLTSLVLVKWQSGYKALRADQVTFFEDSGRLKKTYESNQSVAYEILSPE